MGFEPRIIPAIYVSECRLPLMPPGRIAGAEKVRIPPYMTKCAWCSNL
jgi:hypothetical protein